MVPELGGFSLPKTFGASLRTARKAARLTQAEVAASAKIDITTARALETGSGTIGPLVRVLDVLHLRFTDQPTDLDVGRWIATRRKAAGMTQAEVAKALFVSKPTVIGLEQGRGSVKKLVSVLDILRLPTDLVSRDDGVRLHHGDCLAIMPTLACGSVDLIIADLPYGLTHFDWDQPIDLERLWREFRRVLKPTGAAIFFGSQPFTSRVVMSNPGWFKYGLVWEKTRTTGHIHARHKPLKNHEDLLIFSPGTAVGKHQSSRQMTYNPQGLQLLSAPKRTQAKSSIYLGKPITKNFSTTHTNFPTSILRFASEFGKPHPTQKPENLLRYLVLTFSNPGDTVLDPTCGSGTTGVACVEEGRRFVGIEKDAKFLEIAHERVAGVERG